jgi:hypothetical protein
MKKRLLGRRPSPAMVVAFIALCVGITGGAFAAATIDSADIVNGSITKKDLKNNSVNTKKVKNKTLRAKDFAPGQLKAGIQGIPGLQGEKGDTGPRGPSDVFEARNSNVLQAGTSGADRTLTLSGVPEGDYVVTAKAAIGPSGGGAGNFFTGDCRLFQDGTTIDRSFERIENGTFHHFVMHATINLNDGQNLVMACTVNGAGWVMGSVPDDTKIIALQVADRTSSAVPIG